MEKIVLEKKIENNQVFSWNGQKIEMIDCLDINTQDVLIQLYLNSYFGRDKNYLRSQYELKLAILDMVTNIDIEKDFDIDNVVSSGLWKEIVEKIKNFRDFEYALDDAIHNYKNKEENITIVISEFLHNKVSPLLEKLGTIDMSSDKLEEVRKLMENFNKEIKGTPVEKIFSEAQKVN